MDQSLVLDFGEFEEEYNMQKTLIALILVAAAVYVFDEGASWETSTPAIFVDASDATRSDAQWLAGQQVQGSGMVLRVLPDDNQGSRHQRFILELSSGRTVLVAHNIDLAPRIPALEGGDTIAFYGEFETNDRGGVIHWTHRDPQGRHPDGWLEHKGQRYQ
jgi:hypothetical protein